MRKLGWGFIVVGGSFLALIGALFLSVTQTESAKKELIELRSSVIATPRVEATPVILQVVGPHQHTFQWRGIYYGEVSEMMLRQFWFKCACGADVLMPVGTAVDLAKEATERTKKPEDRQ